MRLSELYTQIRQAGEVGAFAVWLAAPDKDGVDVDLASVGRVEVQSEASEARLYPASSTTDTDSIDPEPVLDMVLDQLPAETDAPEGDLRLVVEVPLMRDEAGGDAPSFADLRAVHIGRSSQEVWLLLRPASEFAPGLLPD
jgi:hypothetical protein